MRRSLLLRCGLLLGSGLLLAPFFFARPSSPPPSSSARPSCRPSSSARPSFRRALLGGLLLRRGLLRRPHRQRLGARLLDSGVFGAHLVKLLLKPVLVVARSTSGRPCSRSRKAPAIPDRQFRRTIFIGPAIGSALPRHAGMELLPARDMHPTYPAWGFAIPARHGRTHPDERRERSRHVTLRAADSAKRRTMQSPITGFCIGLASPGRGCGPWTVLLLSGGLHRSAEAASRIGRQRTRIAIHRARSHVNKKQPISSHKS